ncbi:hypothetical protein HDU99_003831 [Rhizoclosmatium hyalinum]|nr:hypothetical protein HDU99_003831 [Rhizoclosmatium hyalinum]
MSRSNQIIQKERASIVKPPFDLGADNATGSYFASLEDGHRIYYNCWKPNGPIKAQILFFHGLGEHCRRYDRIFDKFASAGILVVAMDWRGHGRTVYRNAGGLKGFHTSFTQVHLDALHLLTLSPAPQGTPLFVAGHSMGGLLALSFTHAQKQKLPSLRGVIAQAPAIAPGKPVPWLIKIIANWLGGFDLFGRYTENNQLELDGLCSDEGVVRDYLRDPLVHGMISLRLVKDMLQHAHTLITFAKQFTTPLIVYHAFSDKFTDPRASEEFVLACGSKDKKYYGFKDARGLEHEIHNEPSVKDRIVSEYIAWIHERATGPTGK